MAQIEITPQSLIVHITGADRLWSLKSHLEIPLAHVTGAGEAADEAHSWLKGFHMGGAHIPSMLSVGTFHQHGDRVYVDVHRKESAIAITLKDDRYARLVIDVEDPAVTIAAITKAIQVPVASN